MENPADYGWVPHKPETWTLRFANLRQPILMEHYCGYWENSEPVMRTVQCKAGQRVKIVMVSRFGDVGITEDLESDRGYGARVVLSQLYNFGENK